MSLIDLNPIENPAATVPRYDLQQLTNPNPLELAGSGYASDLTNDNDLFVTSAPSFYRNSIPTYTSFTFTPPTITNYIYIYQNVDENWVLIQTLSTDTFGGHTDNFGFSLSFSKTDGTYLAVGTFNRSNTLALAYIFVSDEADTPTFTLQETFNSGNFSIGDTTNLGFRVLLNESGNHFLMMGTSGIIEQFSRTGTTWTREASNMIVATGDTSSEALLLGLSANADHSIVVRGSPFYPLAAIKSAQTGIVEVFRLSTTPSETFIGASGERIGSAVAISSNGLFMTFSSLALAADLDLRTQDTAGYVNIYNTIANVFAFQQKIIGITVDTNTASFGSSLALTAFGDILAIGDAYATTFAGAQHSFTRSDDIWTRTFTVGDNVLHSETQFLNNANNSIQVTEVSDADAGFSITIPESTYTGTALALALVTALNVSGDLNLTYTTTYNETASTFTIGTSSGSFKIIGTASTSGAAIGFLADTAFDNADKSSDSLPLLCYSGTELGRNLNVSESLAQYVSGGYPGVFDTAKAEGLGAVFVLTTQLNVFQSKVVIDVTDAEALLVRRNNDVTNTFVVDTRNNLVISEGKLNVNDTTNATTINNGSAVLKGGLGITKDVHIGGNLTATSVTATSATVTDATVTDLIATNLFTDNIDTTTGTTTLTIAPLSSNLNLINFGSNSISGSINTPAVQSFGDFSTYAKIDMYNAKFVPNQTDPLPTGLQRDWLTVIHIDTTSPVRKQEHFAISNGFLYRGRNDAGGSGITVHNITDPNIDPVLVDDVSDFIPSRLFIYGAFLYTVNTTGGGGVIDGYDIQDPTELIRVWRYTGDPGGEDFSYLYTQLLFAGNYMFIANPDGNTIRSYDITSNKRVPYFLNSLVITIENDFSWVISANYIYIQNTDTTLSVVDISDPFNLTLVNTTTIGDTDGREVNMFLRRGYLYFISWDNIAIYNTLPVASDLVLAGSLSTTSSTFNTDMKAGISGDYIYVHQDRNRWRLFNISDPTDIFQAADIRKDDLGVVGPFEIIGNIMYISHVLDGITEKGFTTVRLQGAFLSTLETGSALIKGDLHVLNDAYFQNGLETRKHLLVQGNTKIVGDLVCSSKNVIQTGDFTNNPVDIFSTRKTGSFLLSNNTSNDVITGLNFGSKRGKIFVIEGYIIAVATVDLYSHYRLVGVNESTQSTAAASIAASLNDNWTLTVTRTGISNALVTFDVTSAGQVRITTPSYAGFSEAYFYYEIVTDLNVGLIGEGTGNAIAPNFTGP